MANMERSQHRHRSSPWGSKTDITYNEEEKQTHPRFSQVGSSGSRGMLSTTGWVPTLAYLVNDRPTPFYPKSRATRSVRWFGGSVVRCLGWMLQMLGNSVLPPQQANGTSNGTFPLPISTSTWKWTYYISKTVTCFFCFQG